MDGNERRRFLARMAAAAAASVVAGCDRLAGNRGFQALLASADRPTEAALDALSQDALAQEFSPADISAVFRANGSINPQTPEYLAMAANGFADWRLRVGGLVRRPLALSLAQLRALPARTQITRHDCVEGWSCIGKWKGVPLARVLDMAGVMEGARYVLFRCADSLDRDHTRYYESVSLREARHPQSILAYELNDAVLDIPHGAPLRVRLERKLGYKMAKYLVGVDLVASLEGIGGGQGGYWEDRGYQWHGGI